MDDIFKDLEKAGKTDVDNLMQWMKDSKIIETIKDEKTRSMFNDVVEEQKVELQKFKSVLEQLAVEQKKTVEQLSKQLVDAAPKIVDAAIVGLKAFKEALDK